MSDEGRRTKDERRRQYGSASSRPSAFILQPSALAVFVSRLFDPVWLIPVMLAAAVAWSIYNGLRWRFILILLLIDGLIPFFYFVHLLRTGEISDWDTTKRRERFKLYGAALIIHAVGVIFAWALGKIILAKILFVFWCLAAAYTLVTLVWKISLHTGVFATAAAFAAALWGRNWLMLSLLLFPIAWSRLRLKKHNLAQVIAGALLGPAILLGLFNLLNISRAQISAPSQEGIFNDKSEILNPKF